MYTRQHQASERVYMRRWLRQHGISPVMGQEPSHTEQLMKQIISGGGNPATLMARGRAKVDGSKGVSA